MLWRKAEKKITDWIHTPKGALLVNGARQVGKTYLIRSCLQKTNSHFIEINLIEQPELIPILEQTRTIDDLVINLTAVLNVSFVKGKTVLFIDEVQEVKDLVTQVKFWVEEGSYHYILSGSLLGIELRSLRSAPVGYMEELKIYPLDFEEFLTASGCKKESIQYLENCFKTCTPINEAVHNTMMTHFKRYLIVGGMPAAVQEYVNSGDINMVDKLQRGIIEMYKMDFTKYEQNPKKLMLISVFEQIPSQLLKQNKRFHYSDLQKGLRFERIEDSFLWLTAAGVALPAYNATEPRVSLNQNKKNSLVKLYSADIGLLTCQYGNAARLKILSGSGSINMGGIFENAVMQELAAHGFHVYFYNSHKNGELDFLIEKGAEVVPIEVKSGKDYYVHSAISKACANPEYNISEAYVLGDCNISKDGKITYYPVYLCDFIRDDANLPILAPL